MNTLGGCNAGHLSVLRVGDDKAAQGTTPNQVNWGERKKGQWPCELRGTQRKNTAIISFGHDLCAHPKWSVPESSHPGE